MHRLLAEHPGAGKVDRAVMEGSPHVGEPVAELVGESHLNVGGTAGQIEGGLDLTGSGLHRLFGLTEDLCFGVGDGRHVGVEIGFDPGSKSGPGLHQDHPLMA